ncbi:hypothetical protein ABB37_10002 [Leptomonas pyrrhocoris]|uniref:Uncharacterized protein n=1 Tax=Leptomonas pyrrhocoris TaxID=157538 RepID=A0A0N0VCP4_LEPPY|nr:hypothetical protein ABB37_10002 [Leptomonas pyrrhocoris]KPA73302.1 hypothetical protein ABB37_10002 [Leptomonas pyrrhocoris]|eukprot:XP_015651741.1 hypothetical protein ABB37_10002 [Leptomonas pyrrhocoris]
MPTSAKGAAAHTAADLDAMDDKLRRLGLDVEHIGGSAAPVLQRQSSDDYLRRIRAAKAEKQQAQFDRVARQAVAVEKHHSVNAATASAGKTAAIQTAVETAVTDKALLASDIAEVTVGVRQDFQKSTTQQIRAERMLRAAQLAPQVPQLQPARQSSSLISSPLRQAAMDAAAANHSSKEMATWSSTALARAEAKRKAITPWCVEVAQGVVELAMEVSDHRHLPATGLAGHPVYRLQQDLGVTQWRDWVEELVFGRATAASTAAELQAKAAEATRDGRGSAGVDGSDAAAEAAFAAAQAAAAEKAVQLEAMRCVEVAAKLDGEEAAQVQQRAVASVLAKLQSELVRQRKAAEETVRRDADEAHFSPTSSVEGGGGTTAAKLQREEVLPGWAQRMPPAGCLVYGDDLSGVRLLSDTIEVCMQRSLYAALPNTTSTSRVLHHSSHLTVAAADSAEESHRGAAGEDPEATNPAALLGISAGSDDPFAQFTATEIGVEHGDSGESGISVTYVTPKTLMGTVTLTGTGGDTRRSGSANRGSRSLAHGTPSSGATGGGPQSSAAANSNAGGGGSAVRGGRRGSAVVLDERRSAEQQLTEAAVRELVRVHRHNLGVLAGDKIPTWAPATPSRHASVPSVTIDGEDIMTESVRPSLQTVFLVGFPDSAAFAEHFADRLRSATAAAEAELLEAEARRRAAEQQTVATTAADTGKQRSPSTKGSKGAAAFPSRQKASRLPKAAVEAEEDAVATLAEQLRLTFALPPLSVLSVFLTYDLPTRQRRVEDATFSPEQQQQPLQQQSRGMNDSAEEDILAATAATSAARELMHPVYHPWRVEEKEVDLSYSGSLRRTVSGGLGASASWTPALAFAPSAALPHGFSRAVDAWSVPCLRAELEQQEARQHQQRQAWTEAVSAALVKRSRDAVSGAASPRRVPASFCAAGKRREKPSQGSTPQEADRSSQLSHLTSLNTSSSKATEGVAFVTSPVGPSGTAESGFKLGSAHPLPRALFFVRVLDVSDAAGPTETLMDAAADAHALGRAVWGGSLVSAVCAAAAAAGAADSVGDCRSLAARVATVDRILTQLHLLCRPAGGRVLSSDVLVSHQLQEPFRLGDYRLSDMACVRLRQVHDVYGSVLPEPSSVLRPDRARAKQGNCVVAGATTAALKAEAESWGAVLQYAEDLFSLIAFDVFRDDDDDVNSGSGTEDEGRRLMATVSMLNSTARFTNIDRSYARAKDAIAQHTSHAAAHIQDCLALLLRLSLDAGVAQLAATLRLFCAVLDRQMHAKVGVRGSPLSPSALGDGGVEERLLQSVPRLPEEAARALVALLHVPEASATPQAREDACDRFDRQLSQVYGAGLKAALMDVMSQYFEERACEQAAAPAADAQNGDCPQDTATSAMKAAAQSIPMENLSAIAEVMLEHAATARGPSTRLTLVLQELQQKTQSLHDGADAWVELLYHDALAAQCGNTIQQRQQRCRRPQSIDQLADGPQAVTSSEEAAVAAAAVLHSDPSPHVQPSRWQCGELEVFLATMPPPDASGLVTATSFQRGLLQNQLPRVWRFLPDFTAALAEQVQYTVPLASPSAADEAHQRRHSRCFAQTLSSLPDTALDAYLVFDCPGRASYVAAPPPPFLTAEHVRCLCALATGDGKTGASTCPSTPLKAAFLHLQQWLVDVALHRCCFCEGGCVCAASEAPSPKAIAVHHDTAPLSTFTRCATRHVIPPPSTCGLRQVIFSLPADVLGQVPAFGTEPSPSMVFMRSALPTSPQVGDGWMQTQWWWWPGKPHSDVQHPLDEDVRHDTALCWALWRILLRQRGGSDYAVSASSDVAAAAGTPPPLAPSLLSLMRLLLVGDAGDANPREERVRRAFHCLAALRGVRAGQDEWGTADHDDNASVAMDIEGDMALTRDEYALLGELLMPPVHVQAGESTPRGAAAAAMKGTADLITDVQLLLQVENTDQVSLPLLLSSRWAQLLLAAHF